MRPCKLMKRKIVEGKLPPQSSVLLKVCVAGGSRVQLHVADVRYAGQVHDHALKAQAIARVTAEP